MNQKTLSFTTCNLYNLNEPGIRIYTDRDGWDTKNYKRKVRWLAQTLKTMRADVFGFQELWHQDSLAAVFDAANLDDDYDLLIPKNHKGKKIVCAGAVAKGLLVGKPEWIDTFPDFFQLRSKGDDPQTSEIAVTIDKFSRPVLHFEIQPRADQPPIHVYVCHFKSKGPTRLFKETWYKENKDLYSKHSEAIGSAISTIRRTAEATALRLLLTEQMKGTNTPVVVLGDINDSQDSNTANILTGQPRYLVGFSTGGGDVDLYTAQTLQEYRSIRDVYYTHVFKNKRESLDHILVSQEFYDNSRRRVWAFEGMEVMNDHLNREDHKATGTNDHGIIRASFSYSPAPKKK